MTYIKQQFSGGSNRCGQSSGGGFIPFLQPKRPIWFPVVMENNGLQMRSGRRRCGPRGLEMTLDSVVREVSKEVEVCPEGGTDEGR